MLFSGAEQIIKCPHNPFPYCLHFKSFRHSSLPHHIVGSSFFDPSYVVTVLLPGGIGNCKHLSSITGYSAMGRLYQLMKDFTRARASLHARMHAPIHRTRISSHTFTNALAYFPLSGLQMFHSDYRTRRQITYV